MGEASLEVNQKTFARVVSRTARQIRNLDEQGLPSRVDPESGERLYDLFVAVPWFVRRREAQLQTNERDEAETRSARAKAEMAELELAERRGELVPAELMNQIMGEVLGEVRARFVNLPGSVATQLLGMEDQRDVVAVLQPAVDECLKSMASLADELEEAAEGSDPLPEDFPFVGYIRAAGVTSLQALRRRLDDLEDFTGIGPKRAKRIRTAVESEGLAA